MSIKISYEGPRYRVQLQVFDFSDSHFESGEIADPRFGFRFWRAYG